MKTAAEYDVVIAGGSFVGLTLAIALSRCSDGQLRVLLADRLTPEQQLSAQFDGRTAAITASARKMLEVLGIWEDVAPHAQPVTGIDITDSALETPLRTVLLHFDAVLDDAGPAATVVENAVLRRALFTAAQTAPGLELRMPAAIVSFSDTGQAIHAVLDDGSDISAGLLIAADGQNSALRDAAGIKVVRWTSPQNGIVMSVGHERPHNGRAVQHFLPSGPFAILPLPGNRSSLVWTEPKAEADRILALEEGDLIVEVERRFGGRLGALSVLSRPAAYPLTMTLARDFVRPRFALVGDAAHGLHWIAGQGLNHGLKDVAALTEVLVEALRNGSGLGDITVLRRYERWRRFDSATSAIAAGVLNGLFSNDIAPLRLVRSFGLGVVDRLEPLKRFFIAEAAGITGRVPRLLRGEPV